MESTTTAKVSGFEILIVYLTKSPAVSVKGVADFEMVKASVAAGLVKNEVQFSKYFQLIPSPVYASGYPTDELSIQVLLK